MGMTWREAREAARGDVPLTMASWFGDRRRHPARRTPFWPPRLRALRRLREVRRGGR